MASKQCLYETLNIQKSASSDEIKSAYRKAAIANHPDKCGGDGEKFKKIAEAYEVLSDAKKKETYDRTGQMSEEMTHGMPDVNDILRGMFGQGGGGGGPGDPFSFMFGGDRNNNERNIDEVVCPISLSDVYHGITRKLEFDIVEKCTHCNGIGAVDPKDVIKCTMCNGHGMVQQRMGPFITQGTCPTCGGEKTTIKPNKQCNGCRGKKTIKGRRNIKIEVPKGIAHGFHHKIEKKGNYNDGCKSYNDLVVVFHYIVENPNVEVQNNNINCKVDILLEELLCGFSKTIDIYGEPLTLVSESYFDPRIKKSFKGKGLPTKRGGTNGDLTIDFRVVYSDAEKMDKFLDVFLKLFKRTKINIDSDSSLLIVK
jgi:DnaJ-class molecular chaperone